MNSTKDRRPILDRLMDFYTEDEAQQWLSTPHPQLDGENALNFTFSTGDPEPIHEIIDRLNSEASL